LTIEIRIFHPQPYGHIEMEIKLELDNGFVCDFEPDFDLSINCVDIEKVRWKFQDGTHSGAVAGLLRSTPKHEHTTAHLLPAVRLCDRFDEDIF